MKKFSFSEKIECIAIFVAVMMIFCSCATLTGGNCPYIIDNTRIELGEKEEICRYMGAYFDFYNNSEKTVADFSVSFLVFDDEGKSPMLGSNKIIAGFKSEIPPNEYAEVSLGLDSYLVEVPEKPYEIDYFYVRKINYTDGSSWEDLFGMYTRSANNDDF